MPARVRYKMFVHCNTEPLRHTPADLSSQILKLKILRPKNLRTTSLTLAAPRLEPLTADPVRGTYVPKLQGPVLFTRTGCNTCLDGFGVESFQDLVATF